MDKAILLSELQYKAVRSSGAGGQNVNKVSSKVLLSFSVEDSIGLNNDEKEQIKQKLANRLTVDFVLNLSCDEERSQFKNKTIVTKRFFEILEKSLLKQKPRKATKIPKGAVEKRLSRKKSKAEIKKSRRRPDF
ncbi:alternative ribosome rescue aminoacyl-tRNA hydrolase ArfB [Flavobacterium luminosum]|uniref:Aminoacyl-tRNA hydrolase n=1 Tax=Flavobacterium luminosum TaxID=2949086 RepID=A0ABT0TRR3_9FLAO|nr:alternative ribosome rescue aminoacyl-tRNA hydrolase ArfB [Flavobacterium sp. HXWNR70]MCL9809563.1 aminoacyl-tRNA hydrolase [Flavobacterium sp. HXWNR70]